MREYQWGIDVHRHERMPLIDVFGRQISASVFEIEHAELSEESAAISPRQGLPGNGKVSSESAAPTTVEIREKSPLVARETIVSRLIGVDFSDATGSPLRCPPSSEPKGDTSKTNRYLAGRPRPWPSYHCHWTSHF